MDIIRTVCGLCSGSCGMNLTLENGVIVKIEGQEDHPISQGYLCPKGRALKELVRAPDRLRLPLKKTGATQWLEVSWDEALDFVTRNLKEIKAKYGAEALAVHVGQAGVHKEFTLYVERFCNTYGTPNFSTAGSHCHISKMMANMLTYGVLPVPDFENSSCIVLWGFNPAESCPPLLGFINNARHRGAGLIVIDSRITSLAEKADLHLRLRPGTDGALALGMLNVIIEEKLYDEVFVDKWTIGFEKLADDIIDFSPETAAQITGVPADKIKEAARLYADYSPACIAQGIALELHTNGFQAARAISVLQAICGNLDIIGGAMFIPAPKLTSLILPNESISVKPAIGQNRFPLFYKFTGHAQANIYSEAILEGNPYPLKGMVVVGGNPLLTWPHAGKLKKALAGLEFLAVVDHFMTETAKLADIVLPPATFLERGEIWDTSHLAGEPRVGLAAGVMRDSERMTDWKMWLELAGRMGYDEYFPWQTEEEAVNFRLKPLNLTAEELRRSPSGYMYANRVEKKYEREGFKTASGKVEIYSVELEKYGYVGLPTYKEPCESPESATADDYPLVLTTGARTLAYLHSRYRNLPSLHKLSPEPMVEVHKDKAEELNLSEGETVIVESLRGSIEIKIKITEKSDPEVIYIEHGWDEANANILTDNEVLDPVTGFPPARSLQARIVKMN